MRFVFAFFAGLFVIAIAFHSLPPSGLPELSRVTGLAKLAGAGAVALSLIVFVSVLAITAYLFPTFVAHRKEKRNLLSIFLLNFFLGWTFLGWLGALIWACAYEQRQVYVAPETGRRYSI